MMDVRKIRDVAEKILDNSELFVVDVKCNLANEVEVLIDSDSSVSIDACVSLNRAIEEQFDREEEDFQLTVASAGIGQPLRVFRQYKKLIGSPVEVLLCNGTKIIAELRDATPESITLAYTEKVAVEGKKRKETVEVVKTYLLTEVKSTKEYLDFK